MRRAWSPAPSKPHFEDVFATAERFSASALRKASDFASARRADLASATRHLASHRSTLRSLHTLAARAVSIPYSNDERQALLLLFLPFLMVASAVMIHQSVRTLQTYLTAIAIPDQEAVSVGPTLTLGAPPTQTEYTAITERTPSSDPLLPSSAAIEMKVAHAPLAALPPSHPPASVPAEADPDTLFAANAEEPLLSATVTFPPSIPTAPTELARLAPASVPDFAISTPPPDAMKLFDADENGNPIHPGICSVDDAQRTVTLASSVASNEPVQSLDAETFGSHLAQAAERQVGSFVIYDDAYRSISYPMGDVNGLFGVCTDVIVRAYRALGLDLQVLVHQSRAGTGDRSIDHRRTEVLRRFFESEGQSLPVTSFAENYRPGDIVTYYRPQNQRTRAHIAIVSSVMAPSGRLMIVHNRGWGPQLEDALFVDEITGHYRYRGPTLVRDASALEHQPSPLIKPATTVVPTSLSTKRRQ